MVLTQVSGWRLCHYRPRRQRAVARHHIRSANTTIINERLPIQGIQLPKPQYWHCDIAAIRRRSALMVAPSPPRLPRAEKVKSDPVLDRRADGGRQQRLPKRAISLPRWIIIVCYLLQPQVEMRSGNALSAEALLRHAAAGR